MKKTLGKDLFFSMTLDFLDVYIPQTHNSKKTKKTYQDGLTVFRRYVTDVKHISLKEFTFAQCTFDFVLEYRNWLLDVKHYEKSTVNNRLSSLKAYLYYAAARDVSLQQVQLSIAEVPFLRVPKMIRPVIDNTETMKALLDAPPNTRIGCRDTMILSILFDTMIRADELIHLDLKDVRIDVEIPYLFIHGKGDKERTVALSDQMVILIRAYIKEFFEDSPDRSHPFIYTTIHGVDQRMSERNVERIVKKYANIIRKDHPDLPDSVYPHMFRRSRGTGMYRDGVPIEAIAVAMGHANIQTTKDHYAFPSLEQKKQVMEQGDGLVISKKEKAEWPDNDDEIARICGLR
ncbi:MAG: site-specific integrase [Lachnospiraceae bacterium]|nr:site-specific integrase [Lachnospiraceae bacterium]